jgi:signal transduction histidine kinase
MKGNQYLTRVLHAFYEESPHIFILLNKDLSLAEINKAGLQLLQLQKDSSLGKNVSEILPQLIENEKSELLYHVFQRNEVVALKKITSSHSETISWTAFPAGDGIGITGIDISHEGETLEELIHFTYRISQDLRSPVATLLGFTTMAQREIKNEAALNYFGKMDSELHKLASILQKLIELTQVQHDDLNIQLISFERIIESALKHLSGLEGFSEIAFEKDIRYDQKFYCDKNLLNTIFTQLFDNSIKYRQKSADKAFVRTTISDDLSGVKITVQDNGHGIKDYIQKDIFTMFSRSPENPNGSGLGLYTVKTCVKKLGGNIQVESEPMKGTVFTIYLPGAK